MRIKSLTDIGKSRKENQDNYWSALLNINGLEAGFVCLCDGMGGLNDGGLASKMVVEAIRDGVLHGLSFPELEGVLHQVNKNIFEYAKELNQQMGTTCTLIQCYNSRYDIMHVGDSRCYLLSAGKYTSLTIDHSALKKYGITRENNFDLWRKYKNCLTRCIGVKESVEVDKYSGSYTAGEGFLLCSDGMWHYIDSNRVSLAQLDNLRGTFDLCMYDGEVDNMTGCLLYV